MSASLYAQAVRAGFTRGEFEYQITHQSDDRGKAVAAVSSLMIALATVAVGMRFVARKLNKAPWQADDYATTLSLVNREEPFAFALLTVRQLLAYVLFAIIILSKCPWLLPEITLSFIRRTRWPWETRPASWPE